MRRWGEIKVKETIIYRRKDGEKVKCIFDGKRATTTLLDGNREYHLPLQPFLSIRKDGIPLSITKESVGQY